METELITRQIYEVSYKAAHDYFSDLFSSQIIIFSVIVATMVGMQFYWSYRISKNKIKEEIEKRAKQAENRLNEEYSKKVDMLVKIGASSEKKLSNTIKATQADIYRTMGHFFDSEKSYSVSFIWWTRAAENYALVGEEKLARMALGFAKDAAKKVEHAFEIDDSIGEYQRILSSLNDSLYKIEKDLLNEEVEKILHK